MVEQVALGICRKTENLQYAQSIRLKGFWMSKPA